MKYSQNSYHLGLPEPEWRLRGQKTLEECTSLCADESNYTDLGPQGPLFKGGHNVFWPGDALIIINSLITTIENNFYFQ